MARVIRVAAILVLTAFFALPVRADFRRFEQTEVDPRLAGELAKIAAEAFAAFPALQPGHLSMTVVELGEEGAVRRASFAGDVTYHPASVVKLFYLAAAHREAARGSLAIDAPFEAALRDMIVDSSNDATSYVVDRVTGTTSGPELEGEEFERFVHRRNLVNRWFTSMGYEINANGKTWCEGVYGREKQILGAHREFRNRVTSRNVAALLLWIAERRAVSEEASEAMLALMKRPLSGEGEIGQVTGFGGEALPAGSQLWSKAGWTGEVRHDAMIVELPGGTRYLAAILTRGIGQDAAVLPFLAERIAGSVSTD
ncbi:MAG: serine hydrolase [Thermoanaerobaculia bacterium]